MAKKESLHPQRRRTRAAIASTVTSTLLALGPVEAARADSGPTTAMLEPVRALAAFMAKLPAAQHPTMYAARGVTILENYPPYIFAGEAAVARWEQGFRKHAADGALTELAVEFGPAQDFSASGSRAFFVLPTTWTGRSAGRPFEEHGAWSFVVVRIGDAWKILGYGWGVTSLKARTP